MTREPPVETTVVICDGGSGCEYKSCDHRKPHLGFKYNYEFYSFSAKLMPLCLNKCTTAAANGWHCRLATDEERVYFRLMGQEVYSWPKDPW